MKTLKNNLFEVRLSGLLTFDLATLSIMTTTTLRKTGEIARELCVNYSEVSAVIKQLGIRPAMVIDSAPRFDDAAFTAIAEALAKAKLGEASPNA